MSSGRPTPLSRAQKRLEFWEETLVSRTRIKSDMSVGMVTVTVERCIKLENEMIEKARIAVKDWKFIVRAVGAHPDFLAAFGGKCSLCKKNGYKNDHSGTCPYDDAQRAVLAKAAVRP